MKNFYYLLAGVSFLMSLQQGYSQQNVGIGTINPESSAMLEIKSSEKGFLAPRMSLAQRDLIKNPVEGLLVFQTDVTPGFYYFNGGQWIPMMNSVATGDINGWALDGNASASGTKAAATVNSFIGTPSGIPINFKVGTTKAGQIDANNLFMGLTAGLANPTGINNIGLGSNALRVNTTGANNSGVGAFALVKNVDGSKNLGVGSSSLQENVSGSDNVGVGFAALRSISSTSNNVGIGSFAGFSNTGTGNVFIGYNSGRSELGSNKLYLANSNTTTPLVYGDFSAKFVSIGDIELAKRDAIAASGAYGLLVQKGLLTEKIKVALKSSGDWSDYVFEPTYPLMPLEEVESFTKENKHLPNVPSADAMAAGGLDVAETSKMFMEKIEELTLYLIELNKEVKALKLENEALKSSLK